eukprot:5979588-Pleurochrysis_carterae.AAC.2
MCASSHQRDGAGLFFKTKLVLFCFRSHVTTRKLAPIRSEHAVHIVSSHHPLHTTLHTASHQAAAANPGEMLVNELFIGDHVKISSTCRQLGLHDKGGYQQHKCYMTFQERCKLTNRGIMRVKLSQSLDDGDLCI